MAGFGALLAMFLLVFGAFIATGLADFGAQCAQFGGVNRATGHELSRQAAYICAITIKLNTTRHHLDVGFVEARGEAGFTSRDACIACGDTAFVEFMDLLFHVMVFLGMRYLR